jgi:hypothetical protein
MNPRQTISGGANSGGYFPHRLGGTFFRWRATMKEKM